MTDRQTLEPIPVSNWDDSLRHVVDDMGGTPLQVHALFANRPDLLRAWWPFRKYIVSGGSLAQRDAEIIILQTALHNSCWYEWASHVLRGMQAGLSRTEINRLGAGIRDGWTPAEASLLQAIDDLETHRALRPETTELFLGCYQPEQLLDLIGIHGTYSMLARALNTWPIELDEHVSSQLPNDVTQSNFAALLTNSNRHHD